MNETKQQNHTHPVLSFLTPQKAKKGKIVSPEEAVRVIRAGDTVATGGFVGTGFPEEIAVALERRFTDFAPGGPVDLRSARKPLFR